MKVKTTILAPLFLWIGFFPVYADESMAESIIVQQQVKGIRISGTVLDKEKSPLPGVNVTVKNEPGGAITDVDGHFYIEVPNKQSVLNITYIGFKSKEIVVGNEINFNIILEEDVEALDEVVVVGYGNQKKLSVIGSVQTIEPTKLQVGSSRSLSNNLAGQLAGVIAVQPSGEPGYDNSNFWIRGIASFSGNTSPLVLVDGVERSLNDLDPAEIESFSVLKDASAAIYGARSASGVVLVTTKRGKKGKAQITYNGSISRTIDGIQPPITSNAEWLDMFFEAQYNDARATHPDLTDPRDIYQNINWWVFNSFGGPTLNESDIDPETGAPTVYKGHKLFNALRSGQVLTLRNGDKVERWDPNVYLQDYLYGQATSQKHSVSISGADDKFSYRASLGYANNNSQLKVAEDGEKKYSARLNADYQALDFLKLETNMAYEKRDIVNPSTDVGTGYMDPWLWAVFNENGDAYDTFSGNRNPLGGLIQGGQNKNSFSTFRGGLKATIDFSKWGLEGLSLSGTGNYKLAQRNTQKVYNKVQYYDWVGTETGNKQGPGSLEEIVEKWENITLGAFVNYDRIFKEKHSVSAMLGMTAEQETSKKVGAKRNQGPMYPGSDLTDLDVWISGDNNDAYGGQSSWGFVSYLGRVNYIYDNRYSIELLGRRDGSSKLSKEQRWKNFYSVSGFWRISSEEFMKDFTWLSDLKIRYNYGKTGSVEGIDNYERYALIKTGGTIFGTNPTSHTSLWIDGIRSDQRTWETINSHDVGVDFAFLNNRLRGSFDYFIKRNNGMFINVEYPSILGAGAPKTNNGKFEAKGWEIALNWNDKIGQVTYNLGASLSDAWSKVLELENNENVPNPGKNSNRLIGKPRDALYVYQTDGIFQTQEEVDAYYEMYYWNASHTGPKPNNIIPAPQEASTSSLRPGARKVVDLNGDGSITTADLYYAGDMAPRLTFGIKAGLEWKGIDVAAFFQGVGKQTILRSGYLAAPWTTNYVLQNRTFMGKMWTPENPDAEYTIASRDQNFNKWNYNEKDVQVQNNRYIRLKSLVIGYTIPKKWTAKAGISNLRVYFSGDDLWEWTKVKDGYDPEYGENSNNTFPFSRLLTFGVDVTF